MAFFPVKHRGFPWCQNVLPISMLVPRTDELITKSLFFAACITTSQKWGNSRGNDVFLYPLRDVAKLQGDSHLCSGSGSDHSTGSGVGKKNQGSKLKGRIDWHGRVIYYNLLIFGVGHAQLF